MQSGFNLQPSMDPIGFFEIARKSIKEGSKSFSFASQLLDREARNGTWLLYAFCRFVDDEIDVTDSSLKERNFERLKNLIGESQVAPGLPVQKFEVGNTLDMKLVLQVLQGQYGIQTKWVQDLIRGMEIDVHGAEIRSFEDLDQYCYCVAGVVGLMMCAVMGVREEKAFESAIAMGKSFQIVNIVRDIQTDLQLGRVYLPDDLLAAAGIAKHEMNQVDRKTWLSISRQLLEVGDRWYEFGRSGLKFLPFRSRWAVASAGRIYHQIGIEVLNLGEKAWSKRVSTSKMQKLKMVFLGFFDSLVVEISLFKGKRN